MRSHTPCQWHICRGVFLLAAMLLPSSVHSQEPKKSFLIDDFESISGIAASKEGKYFATVGTNTAILWDADWKRRGVLKVDEEAIEALAFSNDGKSVATSGHDGMIKLWNLTDAKCVATLSGHGSSTRDVVFSRDGKSLFSVGSNKMAEHQIILWDLDSHKERKMVMVPNSFLGRIVLCSDGDSFITVGGTGQDDHGDLRIWDSNKLEELASLKGHEDVVTQVAMSSGPPPLT